MYVTRHCLLCSGSNEYIRGIILLVGEWCAFLGKAKVYHYIMRVTDTEVHRHHCYRVLSYLVVLLPMMAIELCLAVVCSAFMTNKPRPRVQIIPVCSCQCKIRTHT